MDNQSIEHNECRAKQQRLRGKTVEEIISSEKSYLNHLNILVKYFIEPAEQRQLLSVRESRMLFGPIETIINVNNEVLKQCENNRENVAQVFLELAPYFKIYLSYANGYEDAVFFLKRVVEQKDSELAAFLRRQETRPEVGMKLNSLLITPIQRIPRYKLLLEELLQQTPCESQSYKKLLEAVQQVALVTDSINECLREQHNTQRMLRIQQRLTKSRPRIVIPGRKFIKEGVLRKVSRDGKTSQRRIFFLFSDMLMYCKPRGEMLDCCFVTPLKCCRVETLFNCFNGENKNGVLLKLTCAAEELLVYTDNVNEGESWVHSVTTAITLLTGFRQTLRKESSKNRPLRRKALRRLQHPVSLSQLNYKRHFEAQTTNKVDDSSSNRSTKLSKLRATSRRRFLKYKNGAKFTQLASCFKGSN